MGLRNWLFGSDNGATVAETPEDDQRDDEDDEPEKQRQYPVETERVETMVEHTARGSFVRTIELVTAVGGQNILIEYDDKERNGSTTTYSAFSGGRARAVGPERSTVGPSFRTTLMELNETNVLSRKKLGSYAVQLEQDVVVRVTGVRIVDQIESIPDECCRGGVPIVPGDTSAYSVTDNYVVAMEGDPSLYHTGSGGLYARWEVVFVGDERVRLCDPTCHVGTERGQCTVEPQGSTADVIADSIETGTDVMRAVLSDGTVVVPDDEQGLTDEGSDLMRIAELASDRQS